MASTVQSPPRGSTTVASAMVRGPKIWAAGTTVGEAREVFVDDHVHAVLIVGDDGVLAAVVERPDLVAVHDDLPAHSAGRTAGRIVSPHADLGAVHRAMLITGARRLAVVDHRLHLLGLLCLKRSGHGFCSGRDVAARAAQREPANSTPCRAAP